MTTFFKKYQAVITVVVVVFLAFIAYTMFFKPASDDALTVETGAGNNSVEQELVPLLLELRSITLDPEIFNDKRFRGLRDFSQTLVAEPAGRNNPFGPLGKD